MRCDYCTEDRDGYIRFLPRQGIGNAIIERFAGSCSIKISGQHKTGFRVKINYCPICGKKLCEAKCDG